MAFDASTTAILLSIVAAAVAIIGTVWRTNAAVIRDVNTLRGDVNRLSDRMLAVEKETWRLSGRLEIAGLGRVQGSQGDVQQKQ